ncbi:hypothetical protein Gpo141_00011734 [Globisporangium polare]
MPQKQTKRLSWILAALVLASAVFTQLTVEAAATNSTASATCAATTCTLTNGASCNRTVAGCPVCLQFQSATNAYTCTTVVKATHVCPDGFSICESASTSSPSPSSSSSVSAGVMAASTSGDSEERSSSHTSDSGELKVASVETEAPQTSVTTGSSDSGSSFPTWIVIGAGTVVGCILAAVVGTRYANRKRRATEKSRSRNNINNGFDSDGGGGSSTKELDAAAFGESHGTRNTTAMDFSDSVLDLNATPSTSKANYTAAERSTTAAEGAVFLKSDSWRQTTTSSRNTTASSRTATESSSRSTAAIPPPPVVMPRPSYHSFRGSHHVKTLFLDDLQGPLEASQLTTEVAHSVRRESDDVFNIGGDSPNTEWMASGFYDGDGSHSSVGTDLHDSKISILGDNDDGGNASGSTDFYSSKISVLGDHDDDDDFLRRKSERVEDESVAKWKQKFYVEL